MATKAFSNLPEAQAPFVQEQTGTLPGARRRDWRPWLGPVDLRNRSHSLPRLLMTVLETKTFLASRESSP